MTPFITFTGIDDNTDLYAVDALARLGVEFGILLTNDPEGRKRYPNKAQIKAASIALGVRLAVHVCGKTARADALNGVYDRILHRVGRIQVNGIVTTPELHGFIRQFPDQQIITQYGKGNNSLAYADTPDGRHALLVDDSAGNGQSPTHWNAPGPLVGKSVGFAGGLGPDNIATELPRIRAVAGPGWWVDMESKLRDADDWFSLERCADVINKARPIVGEAFA